MDVDGHISSQQHCTYYTRWQYHFPVPKTILDGLISFKGVELHTSCHVTSHFLGGADGVYFQYGNAVSIVSFYYFTIHSCLITKILLTKLTQPDEVSHPTPTSVRVFQNGKLSLKSSHLNSNRCLQVIYVIYKAYFSEIDNFCRVNRIEL